MDGIEIIAIVEIADILQRADDRELSLVHARSDNAEIEEIDLRAHSVLNVLDSPCFRADKSFALVGHAAAGALPAGSENARDMGTVIAIGGSGRFNLDELLHQAPVNRGRSSSRILGELRQVPVDRLLSLAFRVLVTRLRPDLQTVVL